MLSWGEIAVGPAPDRANPVRSQEIDQRDALVNESVFRRFRQLAAGSAALLRAVLREGAARSGTGDINVAGRDRGPTKSRRLPARAFRSR